MRTEKNEILVKQARVAVVRRTVSIQNIKTYKTTETMLKTTSHLAGCLDFRPFFLQRMSKYRLKPPKYIVRGRLKARQDTKKWQKSILSNQTMFFRQDQGNNF